MVSWFKGARGKWEGFVLETVQITVADDELLSRRPPLPCDPRILRSHRISNGSFDAPVDAIDSHNQTKGFAILPR